MREGLTPEARAGAVQSPRKREGGRKENNGGRSERSGMVSRAHPSMVREEEEEEEEEEELFWSASPPHRTAPQPPWRTTSSLPVW